MDLDQNTFSPPDHEDTFLYIRYPNKSLLSTPSSDDNKTKYTPITDLIERNNISPEIKTHTKSCLQYLNGAKTQPKLQAVNKSNGVDDGFKGEGAACGTSVVRVAHQMVVQRGFNPVLPSEEEEAASPPVGWNPSTRRGSKSLPSSPVSQRKQLTHKYFTSAFADNNNEKPHSSWILSTFLSQRNNISKSVNTLAEEDQLDVDISMDKKKSTSGQIFKAKPSELREMNFWSPTSM